MEKWVSSVIACTFIIMLGFFAFQTSQKMVSRANNNLQTKFNRILKTPNNKGHQSSSTHKQQININNHNLHTIYQDDKVKISE